MGGYDMCACVHRCGKRHFNQSPHGPCKGLNALPELLHAVQALQDGPVDRLPPELGVVGVHRRRQHAGQGVLLLCVCGGVGKGGGGGICVCFFVRACVFGYFVNLWGKVFLGGVGKLSIIVPLASGLCV